MRTVLAGLYGGWSGIEVYTRTLAAELARRGHEVVVADRSPGAPQRDLPEGVRPVALPPRGRLGRLAGPLDGRAARAQVGELAADADVLHATHLDLAPGGATPLVVTAWDPEPTARGRIRLAPERGLGRLSEARYALVDRRALGRARAVIAVSRAVERSLGGLDAPVAWIPPFLPDAWVREPRPARARDVVMVANDLDSPRKGLDLALAAVERARAHIPDLRLVLVGTWVDEARAAALPDWCDVRGRIPREELPGLLHDAGCCVVPSLWEEFGYAALEALAAGCPVVCGALPGLVELGCDGVLQAPERSPEAFAGALRRAVALEGFGFPAACRASEAVPRTLELYAAAAAG